MLKNYKWTLPVLVIFLIVILGVYLFPTPNKSYLDLSGDVPERQTLLYQGFKNQYALKKLVVSDVTWEYIVVGPPGESILFLHGMSGAYDLWWQQMFLLRQDYRMVSVTYPAVDNLEEISSGILAILESEGIRQTTVVGTSLGGYIAQYLVTNFPERFTRAIYSNTFPPNEILKHKYSSIASLVSALPEWAVMKVLADQITNTIYPASGFDPFTQAYLLDLAYGGITKDQLISRSKVVFEPFIPLDPAILGIQVLIFESENDPLLAPELRQQMRDTYPFSNVYTFTDAGHYPYLNFPEEYTQQLVRFLNQPMPE